MEGETASLFGSAPVWFAMCGENGRITAVNPALAAVLGRESGESLPVRLADLVHPDDRGGCERLLRELFEGRRESGQVDSRFPLDGQATGWVLWRYRAEGKPVSVIAMGEPIPERQEAEQRLQQAHKLEAMGRLAGGVAHDFNNLLTGVLLYCDLLLTGLEPGHRLRSYGEEIRRAALEAAGLVRQLLNVARPAKLEARLLSLNQVAEGMQNLLGLLVGEGIELHFHLDPQLGLVRMNHTQAQQILLNLVLNARDAVPKGGKITVETSNYRLQVFGEASGVSATSPYLPCALFVVADNGSGMDEQTRAHLFEAFFTTKGGKGTGLGLMTVHHIVTSNGGLIHIDSAPGCGTRVRVLLPLVAETASHLSDTMPTIFEKHEQSFCVHEKETSL